MATEKNKSASDVLTDFLGEQADDESLDAATALAIHDLLSEGKLTKTNLLQQLEKARSKTLKDADDD